jgi:hypothetical protein
MSRLYRGRRRAGHAAAEHERARTLAAQRLDEAPETVDANWLADHLAGCESCRAIATEYEADRIALRGLRDLPPQPPRDLWARTSAAIEREAAASGRRPRRATGAATTAASPRRWPMVGAIGAVAVVVGVIGASLLSGGFLTQQPRVGDVPSQAPIAVATGSINPGPTPLAVGAGSVGWIGPSTNGRYAVKQSAAIDEVCAVERQADCAPVRDQTSNPVEIAIQPKSITRSPAGNQAVVVGTDSAGSDKVVVIALPSTESSASPNPTVGPTPMPAAPSTQPSSTPTATPAETPMTSEPPASEAPSPTPAETPEATPTASVAPSATPSVTPEPTVAATLAIASNVKIVGESASFSPDGSWFAFTARPSDDLVGPDIYVWRVGDAEARKLTNDHVSVFASWAGDQLIGSRPMDSGTQPAEFSARSFLIDPTTTAETELDGSAWRPVVDPSGHWALTWNGTVRLDDGGLSITPASGSLAVRPYTRGVGIDDSAGESVVTDSAPPEFDARWDETGTWLAVWLADPSSPAFGRLSLHHLDRATGKIEHVPGAPRDVTALPGFSIADGRLAWATPPGQGGEGSRVQVVAWSNDTVGSVETGPMENVVVIH